MSADEEWLLGTRWIGHQVRVYNSLESTNTEALSLAENSAHAGVVILARKQTAGRGQHGRTWEAPGDTSVLLSALVYPPSHIARPVVLTAWAAVSVCNTIQQITGSTASIKWPNDVLLGGQKVCGILIEQRKGTVVGIGLNVLQTEEALAAQGLTEATSLCQWTSDALNCSGVAQALILELDQRYQDLLEWRLNPLEEAWQERMGLLGENVELELAEGILTGRLLTQALDQVVVQQSNGIQREIQPESILHISKCSSNG